MYNIMESDPALRGLKEMTLFSEFSSLIYKTWENTCLVWIFEELSKIKVGKYAIALPKFSGVAGKYHLLIFLTLK